MAKPKGKFDRIQTRFSPEKNLLDAFCVSCHSDLLTVEEFADKLKVSRSTVFSWLKSGLLQEGKHYFRIGRIIRFVWDAGLFIGRAKPKKLKQFTRPPAERPKYVPSQPGINLEYGSPS